MTHPAGQTLYLLVCGAGPADRIDRCVALAGADGWDVWCLATPSAVDYFLDLEALAEQTGHSVRTDHQRAGQPPLPPAAAAVVAPATYNTINKWAAGVADNYVLTQLAELTGLRVPIAALPFVNAAQARNLVFSRSIRELRRSGVTVLFGEGGAEPHAPGAGGQAIDDYPWKLALSTVGRPGGGT